MRILITGSHGYIGSRLVKSLKDHELEFIDLKYNCCISESSDLVKEFDPELVIHLAAFIDAGESMRDPVKYYNNNVNKTLQFFDILKRQNVKNIIFASSAAVYAPAEYAVSEVDELNPSNHYGHTKKIIEKCIPDYFNNYIIFRFFNVAGGKNDKAQHLIAKCIDASNNNLPIEIYGTDFNTDDGTAIRDYVHVDDIVDLIKRCTKIHTALCDYGGRLFNIGYGEGRSVKEVIESVWKVTGKEFSIIEGGRRIGDQSYSVADNTKIIETLKWEPKYNDLEYIIKSSL